MVEVGALVPAGVERGELLDLHHLGGATERDELQGVAAEPAADQGVEGQRGPLHRDPAAVHGHREGRVDQQRHRRLGAVLGLLDLDVVDLQRAAARVRGATPHAVEDGARQVPRLGVAEPPLAGGAGQVTGGTGGAQLALSLSAGHPVGHVAQQHLAELPHRLRAQPVLTVGAALEVPAVAERLLELLQGSGVDGRPVAELSRERVEVEVVEPRAVVRLGELVAQRVELGEVLDGAGAVAETEALTALEPLGARPVLIGPQRLKVGVHPGELLHQGR